MAPEDSDDDESVSSADAEAPVLPPGINPLDLSDESRTTDNSATAVDEPPRMQDVMASFIVGEAGSAVAELVDEGVRENCAATVYVVQDPDDGGRRTLAVSPSMNYAARGGLLAPLSAVEYACLVTVVPEKPPAPGGGGRTPVRA